MRIPGLRADTRDPWVQPSELGFRDHPCAHCSIRDAHLVRLWKAIFLTSTPSEAVKPRKSTPFRTYTHLGPSCSTTQTYFRCGC